MVLAAVDDLLFSSKIRTVAKLVGTNVVFVRTREDVLERARELNPTLVIVDLNSRVVDPLGTIASLKADPVLRAIRTIGFVSHVQASLIESARAAGTDDVMARSAFAANLQEILESARAARP
jgi:CheY-like chemotaxis protein